MKKNWVPILMAFAALLGLWIGWICGRNAATNEIAQQISSTRIFGRGFNDSKIQNIKDLVRNAYVDEVDIDSVEEVVIPDVLKMLDPHSLYIPAKSVEHVASELKSDFGGIGVSFSIREDTVNIISVMSGGPSSLLGVLPGDKIIKVDDKEFVGKSINNQKVMDTLRGEIGTKVKISVLRHGDTEIDFDITRDEIPLTSVDVSYMIADSIGYMKIDRFAEKTYEEMQTGIAKLKQQGCCKLIVDLRGNSGGFLNVVSAMVNEFLKKDQLIVYTEGAHQRRHNTYADGRGASQDLDLIVLIDEYSASASEIFAGAVQDNDRGTVIGRRSFGKGLVQTEMSLSDGSGLRLTVARYHTPSGRCIQRPYDNGTEEYYDDVNARYMHGELFSEDSIVRDTTQIFHTLNKNRVVYGGGGITPDIFVPYDSAMASKYLYQLRAKRLIYDYALSYADKHREEFKNKNADELIRTLMKLPLFNGLTEYASRHGLKYDGTIAPKERTIIENEVRAYIGQMFLNNDAFYPILNTMDPAIDRALSVWDAKATY